MYLGEYKIDDYVDLIATTHRASTGGSYDATSITYTIYEDGSSTEIISATSMSKFDSETGFYYTRLQLTTASGFENGKTYVALIKATVDSISSIDWRMWKVQSGVNVATIGNTTQTAGDIYGWLTTAITELSQGQPVSEPDIKNAIMLIYMYLRNQSTSTSGEIGVYNNAGTKIAKSTLTDNGTTFTKSKMISGA